jgi:hypothetical protein
MKHTDLQIFFKERMLELFHKDTLDSYRVRNHNVFSLIKELRELIKAWQENRIKQFSTIQLCIEELVTALQKDGILDFSWYNKNLFRKDIEYYSKNGEKLKALANKTIFILSQAISENESKYLPSLFEKIKETLLNDGEYDDNQFVPIAQELDNNVSALCSELLNRGYSKIHLFSLARYFNELAGDYQKEYDSFKAKFIQQDLKEYTVIFKVRLIDKLLQDEDIAGFSREIYKELITKDLIKWHSNFLRTNRPVRYFIKSVNSLDPVSAIKQVREQLSSTLDVLHLGMSSLNIDIPSKALVISKQGKNKLNYEMRTQYVLDGCYSNDISLSAHFRDCLCTIVSNDKIKQEVKDRLNSALRHLRLGNNNAEIEQQFINYWIALEFIFSSPESSEGTFTRLKYNLVNVLTCCYIKRNLLALNDVLKNGSIICDDIDFENYVDIDTLIQNIKSPLLRFRLLKMKSRLFGHKDKIKEFFENHEKNLNQNIVRIYRLRNELIHEAANKQNIENITSNLRYYLVFLLNQMIIFFASYRDEGNSVGMEDFFFKYEIMKKGIIDSWDLKFIMNVPLEMELLR